MEHLSALGGPEPLRDVYNVSRLNREIKGLLETRFPLIWIEGEVSNLASPTSGHLYFSLKDDQAQVRCALFRTQQRGLHCRPRDGMHVLARVRVTLYEGRGDYQLIVEYLEEAGEGALRQAFEALKQKLAREGLFDLVRKQPLPALPRRLGLITSPSGAVLHDILTTLRRRFPAIPVLLYPVPVQGAGAAQRIAAAIRLACERRDCDALILARGGGSLEDLWAFNEEVVARAIAACAIPIVCGVGHETDVTIADLVADARAPTPTAAAELLSPDQGEWLARVAQRHSRLVRLLRDRLQQGTLRLDWLAARLVHPRQRLAALDQRTQTLARRLHHAQLTVLHRGHAALLRVSVRLYRHSPQERLRGLALHRHHLSGRLAAAFQHLQDRRRQRLATAVHRLQALSPLAVLARGYAILELQETGEVVRDAARVHPGDRLHARLSRGRLGCRVEETFED